MANNLTFLSQVFEQGGVETRKLWTDSQNALWIRNALNVPNCCSLFCVERTAKCCEGTVSCDVHYYMSSLDISYWRAEDKHYLSMPGLSEKFTCLSSRSLNVLRFLRKGKELLTAVSARVRDNLKHFLKRLVPCQFQISG